jgi:predicted GNAT family acetyltransferase
MPLRLTRARDPDELDRLAFEFLSAREAEHNLLFGIVTGVRAGEYATPPYFAVVRDGARVVAVALRTAPFNLVLSTIDAPAAIAVLVDDALALWPDLPGVLGPTEQARRFAELWAARTGRAATVRTAERIFRLEKVVPPRPASGAMRLAEPKDRARIAAWFVEFGAEALRLTQDLARMEAFTDRFIARLGGRAMYLWDDAGPVCMTGASAVTPHGSRVGPVYTPPQLRGRGYASALVAAVSQAQFDAGRRFCFLFTDLANPTSNKIYQDIGYEPVCDVDEYRFEVPGTADT